jgi:hypothetical protein
VAIITSTATITLLTQDVSHGQAVTPTVQEINVSVSDFLLK